MSPLPARSKRRFLIPALLTLLITAGSLRIVATYRVFSQTFDEAEHIHSGLAWLSGGSLKLLTESAPLPRIAAALPLYLKGVPYTGDFDFSTAVLDGSFQKRVARPLYYHNDYRNNLAWARFGELPFFWAGCLGVFYWCRELFGEAAALMAVLLFSNLPPVLAHAGLATLDMALAGVFIWAIYGFTRWLAAPGLRASLVLGAVLGITVLCKLSSLGFFPAAVALILFAALLANSLRTLAWRRLFRQTVLVSIVALLTIWAGYRFSIGTIRTTKTGSEVMAGHGLRASLARQVSRMTLPGSYFIEALGYAAVHVSGGHPTYFLGRTGTRGWWYFFPVALAVKTPLGFLLLAGLGIWLSLRLYWRKRSWVHAAPAASAAAILLVGMASPLDIGIRHMLPLYPMLAIAAGAAAVQLWNSNRRLAGRALAVLLTGWTVVSAARIHPDYIAYFNELGGSHPENILVHSDLDWGQDLYRLCDRVRDLHIDALSIVYFGSADLARFPLHVTKHLTPEDCARTTGWVAASLMDLKTYPQAFQWLDRQPYQTVGRSIRLYWIAP